jgi:hypothetical protein
MGSPADWPREVNVMSMSLAAAARVVKEQLVEIAHPIEHQRMRMLGFDAQVLLHHRGVLAHL